MAIEIERKFLVANEYWKPLVFAHTRLRQAYLTRSGKTSVRVRVVNGETATLTIKSRGARLARAEFIYPIPLDEAETLLQLREGLLLSKVRHLVRHDGIIWEIDVFEGAPTPGSLSPRLSWNGKISRLRSHHGSVARSRVTNTITTADLRRAHETSRVSG